MRLTPFAARSVLLLLLATACGGTSEPEDPPVCGSKPCDGQVGGDGGQVPRDGGSDAGTVDAGSDADAGSTDAGADAGPTGTFILFDPLASPRVIPQPNNLDMDGGRVNVTPPPGASPTEQEFTRDYLNTLNGVPGSTIAGATASAPLDPSTVTLDTVRVRTGTGLGPLPAAPTVSFNPDTKQLQIIPPPGGWPRDEQTLGRFVVVLVGGPEGMKDLQGAPVGASPAWQRVRSTTALVDSSGHSTDPDLSDADARTLEELRKRYAPFLDNVELYEEVRREDVVALWTFTVVTQSEVTFSPSTGVVPFPSSFLMKGNQVSLPLPSNGTAFLTNLTEGLNRRDGFSTTGMIVSENNPLLGALRTGRVDASTLEAGTRFVRVDPGDEDLSVDVCLNCASSLRPDGTPQEGPQQLQFIPRVPLAERTTYAAVVTTDLGDERGLKVMPTSEWALLRLSNPLVNDQGRSQLSIVPDAVAASLEPVRQSLKPALDALEAQGLPRSRIALASVFRTQSTRTALDPLVTAARTLPDGVTLDYLFNASSELATLDVPQDALGGLYRGGLTLANFLTASDGTFDMVHPRRERAELVLTVPNTAMPAEGWPVVLFAHDLGRDRNDLLLVANELARAGFAAIALDAFRHGERSTCVGLAALGGSSDDAACADPARQRCETSSASVSFGRCVARDMGTLVDCGGSPGGLPGDVFCASGAANGTGTSLGRCVAAADNRRVCEGGAFATAAARAPLPPVSGWNALLVGMPLTMADGFRQQAMDLAQGVRLLKSSELATALAAVKLNTGSIHLVGQGLGGMTGALFTSVDDELQRVVLNAPLSDVPELLFTAPDFNPLRTALLSFLSGTGFTRGTPEFDAVLSLYRQALDPADPLSMARGLKDRADAPAGRDVLFQSITEDTAVPGTLTDRLVAAANSGAANLCPVSRWNPLSADLSSGRVLAPRDRHAFLRNGAGDGTLTRDAQQQAATFLSTGTVTALPGDAR